MPDFSADRDREAVEPGRTRRFGQVPASHPASLEPTEIVRVLDEYLTRLTSGQDPQPAEFVARYPHLAPQLEACLAGLEFIHRAEGAGESQPRQLGDFHLLREVGRGGMGAVYEAEQASLGRRVAVKVLRFGAVSDPEAVDRFRREAETVAQLHHTHVVPIFYVGLDQGVNYYAMQFIEGRSLAEVLAEHQRPIDAFTVITWGLQAAEALSHAHQRGVIHRDVKPPNLILDRHDHLWLTDFGLAKRADDVTFSITGALLGTPRHMSPEQASAARHQLDHRTDIYSLGATLYELATGQPVFAADKPYQVIGQILHDEPRSPRQIFAGVPQDLETILLTCLSKQPDQRYASAHELAEDLRAVLDGRPIRARRASLVERGTQWVRRHHRSLRLTTAAVTTTILMSLLAVLSWMAFARFQQADLWLTTKQSRLTAVLRDAHDKWQTRVTVPTEQALTVRAGRYRLELSGEQQLSAEFDLRLRRGTSTRLSPRLDDALWLPPLQLERSYRLVRAPVGGLAIELDDDGLKCLDLRSGQFRWTTSLRDAPAEILREHPGWVWPWHRLTATSPYRGWGAFDSRPWINAPGDDLNADGVSDLLLAARHQACVCAISGSDGQPLWVAARAPDLAEQNAGSHDRLQRGIRSAVLHEPVALGDLDGDGMGDLLASFASQAHDREGILRWVEAISGRTGQTIWRTEVEERWLNCRSQW